MECFPQCEPCTGLCKAPVQGSSVSKRTRIEYTDRRVGLVMTCGHVVEAPPATRGPLVSIVKEVWCDDCGKWRKLRNEQPSIKVNEPPGQDELVPF